MLPGYTSNSDGGWPGGDGTFDPLLSVIALGVVAPLVCVALAAWCVVGGDVVLPGEHGPALHLHGPFVVTAAVLVLIGVAAAFVGRYFWPNVFRQNSAGEPIGAVGLAMAVLGLIGIVVAGLR